MVLSACNQGKKTLTSWSPFRGICNHLECSAEAQCGAEHGSVCACQNQHSATGTCSEPLVTILQVAFTRHWGGLVALSHVGAVWLWLAEAALGGPAVLVVLAGGFQPWEIHLAEAGWLLMLRENCLWVFVLVRFRTLIFSFLTSQDRCVVNPSGSCYLWVHEDAEGTLLWLYCLVRVFLFLFGCGVCSPN